MKRLCAKSIANDLDHLPLNLFVFNLHSRVDLQCTSEPVQASAE